jgi:hypothetical protein
LHLVLSTNPTVRYNANRHKGRSDAIWNGYNEIKKGVFGCRPDSDMGKLEDRQRFVVFYPNPKWLRDAM